MVATKKCLFSRYKHTHRHRGLPVVFLTEESPESFPSYTPPLPYNTQYMCIGCRGGGTRHISLVKEGGREGGVLLEDIIVESGGRGRGGKKFLHAAL